MTQLGTALLPPPIPLSPHPPFDQQSDVGFTSVHGKWVKWWAPCARTHPYRRRIHSSQPGGELHQLMWFHFAVS